MKRFNKNIQIQISVDSIADSLLSTIKENEKHKELIVEAIITSALDKGTISYIYNALNGYPDEVNFKVGDKVLKEMYFKADEKAESEYHQVELEVVEVRTYHNSKVRVFGKYQKFPYGKMVEETYNEWVNHQNISKIPV